MTDDLQNILIGIKKIIFSKIMMYYSEHLLILLAKDLLIEG